MTVNRRWLINACLPIREALLTTPVFIKRRKPAQYEKEGTMKEKPLWVSDHGDQPQGYLAEVIRVGETLPRGGLYQIDVLHDDWCDLLTKSGHCTCEPEVHPGKRLV